LLDAAALSWQIKPEQCSTENGQVVNSQTGARLSYGDLATAAAALPLPDVESVPLKQPDEYKILGTWVPGVDNRSIVTGKPLFASDQRLPGMRYAVYQKCPNIGGVAKSANLEEIKSLPGVIDAFILEGNGDPMALLSGVAIVAASTYQAFEAKNALT